MMNNKQSKALYLADALENDGKDCTCAAYALHECGCGAAWAEHYTNEAAAELRRLHELNAELMEALQNVIEIYPPLPMGMMEAAEAAIAKAQGDNNANG